MLFGEYLYIVSGVCVIKLLDVGCLCVSVYTLGEGVRAEHSAGIESQLSQVMSFFISCCPLQNPPLSRVEGERHQPGAVKSRLMEFRFSCRFNEGTFLLFRTQH